MGLPHAGSLFIRHKSHLYLIGSALIGLALICFNHISVESKAALAGDGKEKKKKKKEKEGKYDSASASARIFQGGLFEASGVVAVPGTDGVLFVDDNRADEVLWMRLDRMAIRSEKLSRSRLESVSRILKGSLLTVPGFMSSARNPIPK